VAALVHHVGQLESDVIREGEILLSADRADPVSLRPSAVEALAEAGRRLEQAGESLRRAAEALSSEQQDPGTPPALEKGPEEELESTGSCSWCGTRFDTQEALFEHLGGADGMSPCREGILGSGG